MNHPNLVQSLEPRRLLAASFASLSSHGTLSIIGTTKNDTITISLTNGKIVAKLNSASMSFAKSSVNRIWADGFRGNDHIENDTALPSTLLGSSGNDTLRGGSGNDSLDGGDGADLVQPRDGTNVGPLQPAQDVLDYAGATAGEFYVQYDGASAYVTHGSNRQDIFQCSVQSQFDTLRFFATEGKDHVSGIAEAPVDIHGAGGDDTLDVSTDNGAAVALYGDAGNDRIYAADDDDLNIALGDGGPGNDQYYYGDTDGSFIPYQDSGGGFDKLTIDASRTGGSAYGTEVPAGIESCEVFAYAPGFTLKGNSLNNVLKVDGYAATILGGAGNDTLIGGPGRDKLYGQDGDDTIYAKDGRTDTLDGGAGFDTAQRDNTATIKDQVLNIEKFI